MNRNMAIVALIAAVLVASGCGGVTSPLHSPDPATTSAFLGDSSAQTDLWGYYDVYLDLANETATVVLNRSAMFTMNVVSSLNKKPADLGVGFNSMTPGAGYVDMDLNVSITHPLAGLTQYNVYDMRGIFIGNGSSTLHYMSPKLVHPVLGSDQFMMDDPSPGPGDPAGGGPDGYTRWFNPSEFMTGHLFGYTAGIFATKSYVANGTLNAYKYFADGLGANADVLSFLQSTSGNGVFSAGTTNTRNYYIRFPVPSPGAKFSYAIAASWEGTAPSDHPANADEAVGGGITVTPDITFTSPTSFGGNLIADITVFDWKSALAGGVMTDYTILIDSTVLSSVYTATAGEMTPTATGSHWFTYHFSIPADHLTGLDGNTMWAIVQYTGKDYSNPFGVPNMAGTDPLAAFFSQNVPVNPGTQTFDVSMTSSFTFDPVNLTAPAGATVTWTNNAGFPHTATSDPANPVAGGPDSDTQYPSGMPSSAKYSWMVPNVASGTVFYYHCRFHGVAGNGTSLGTGMAGSITVK